MNSAFELKSIAASRLHYLDALDPIDSLGDLRVLRCGKKLKGSELTKSSSDNPIIWKSPGLHKGGYEEGSYPEKVK